MPRYSEKQKAALDALMREDVYRQATEIITAEGLPALTMDRLAKGVGVSRGTLYNYFADRDAVVDFVEERTFTPLLDSLQEIGATNREPEAKLEMMAREVFSQLYENRMLVVALSPEKHNAANRHCHFERRCRGLETLERTIRDGIEAGRFRDLPPELSSQIFFGVISGMIEHMVFDDKFRKPEEIVPTLMEIFLGGLRAPQLG